MKVDTAVCCMEVMETQRGVPLAIGVWAIRENERFFFSSIQELAAFLVTNNLKPTRIPEEEGWENCVDLPDMLFLDVMVTMTAEMVDAGKTKVA